MDRPSSRRGIALGGGTAAVLPPLGLMAVIWLLSSQPDLTTGLGLIDLIGRKLVHAASFALLCFLWWRALREQVPSTALAVALAITLVYGAVDEYHQSFVDGRTGSPLDVAIDSVGAAVAAVLIRRRRRMPDEGLDRGAPTATTASRAR